MKLSDYFRRERIIRDCSFEALGLSNSDPGVAFLSFFDNNKYYKEICENRLISGIICEPKMADFFKRKNLGVVISANPRKTYFKLHNFLSNNEIYYPKLCKNRIGKDCKISKNASLSEFGIIIGNNVTIEDFVRIYGPCYIGDNTIIHAGVSIGGAGFEFKRYQKDILDVVHCGSVSIGHSAIIWENVTIHRAVYPWDKTVVGNWARIGAQSHVDHGAKIKDYAEICAGSVISGRVSIGEHAFLGPGCVVANRISVAPNTKVLLGSVVTKNVDEGQVISGNFAIEHAKHLCRVKEDSNI